MGRTYDRIDDHMRGWIARQPLFFVGTAPRADDGHVNVSPKGPIGTLRVNALAEYQAEKNAVSIDGLPALDP